MRQNHVHAVDAERIALLPLQARPAAAFRRRLIFFAFALLEGIEIIENVVADFFEIFRDLRAGIFFLQLFDHAVHQHRSGFLLQVTHFAGQLARKRKRLAVNDREFLAELIVLSLEFFRGGAFELPFLHHLGDFLDGHHLPFEHRKNFRQRHGAHLHAAQRELLARDAAREIVHQFFFAHREALDDARLLPLERLAFENLRNAPAQKIDSGFHFLLEGVGLAARQSQQARPVGILEIIHVAAIGSRLALRVQSFDHAHDHAAAAGSGKPADEKVVAGRGQFHAHAQGAQRAFLPGIAGRRRHFGGSFKRNTGGIAAPAKFFRRQSRVYRCGVFWRQVIWHRDFWFGVLAHARVRRALL